MKQFFFFISLLFLTGVASATNSDFFEIDKNSYNKELSKLQDLESFVTESNLTVLNLTGTESFRLEAANVKPTFSITESFDTYEKALGIPGFVWGFCLGGIGVVVVYLVADDKEETKKAVYGCLTSVAISLVLQLAVL